MVNRVNEEADSDFVEFQYKKIILKNFKNYGDINYWGDVAYHHVGISGVIEFRKKKQISTKAQDPQF